MTWVGMGYRSALAGWISTRPPEVQCVEVTAEHFFDGGFDDLKRLTAGYPVFVHGLGLSLGTPGALEQETLDRFVQVVQIAKPEWVSEHVAFSQSTEVDLGHLNPIRLSREMVGVIAEHANQIVESCGCPIILENISSYLRLEGEMSEPDFLNRVCETASCGLLLDVTNLFINSRNHAFDATAWLHQLDPRLIVQLHVVGYSQRGGQWHDFHSEPIQADLMDLICEVLDYAPVQAITLERDANFPPSADLARELTRLKEACDQHQPYDRVDSAP